MGINVPLLRKVLEYITDHPDEWDQNSWAVRTSQSPCGTTHCIAGHAVSFVGYHLDWFQVRDGTASHVLPNPNMAPVYSPVLGYDTLEIEYVARHHLGLDQEEADSLFYIGTDLRHAWQAAHALTNGEIEVPAHLAAIQEVSE